MEGITSSSYIIEKNTTQSIELLEMTDITQPERMLSQTQTNMKLAHN